MAHHLWALHCHEHVADQRLCSRAQNQWSRWAARLQNHCSCPVLALIPEPHHLTPPLLKMVPLQYNAQECDWPKMLAKIQPGDLVSLEKNQSWPCVPYGNTTMTAHTSQAEHIVTHVQHILGTLDWPTLCSTDNTCYCADNTFDSHLTVLPKLLWLSDEAQHLHKLAAKTAKWHLGLTALMMLCWSCCYQMTKTA